jgi:hypothetical protein
MFVPRLNCYKCLGVTLDEKLNWEHHIDMIIKKVNAGIAVIKRMKTCVPQEFLQTVYNALIQPYFDYCCQLWDTCGIVLIRGPATKIILKSSKKIFWS